MKRHPNGVSLGAVLLGLSVCTVVAQPPPTAAPTPPLGAPEFNPSGPGRGTRAPAGPLPPAPIPENLDAASTAAGKAALAGPFSWPSAPASTAQAKPFDSTTHLEWAPTPPMGWNSWDCFGAGIWQADALANTDYMAKNLKAHGWNYVVIDIQWYEPLAHTENYRRGAGLVSDANGRLHPAPNRFPLTADTGSFKPIADYIHARGLKFGLHLMRGIPRQAVDRDNAPILGTPYHAQDIADRNNVCFWNTDMYGVDMSKPGAQEYYDSVFALLASWDLDFVKVDDLSGHNAEIEAIRKAIDKTGRPIVFSVSPGGGNNDNVATNANMWRISGDFWDNWPALYAQFARVRDATPFRGAGHWPDADMIPFDHIRVWKKPFKKSAFTKDEQYTLMSLWCIGRSPLMFGGDMPQNDEFTFSLLTNDEVLAVNQKSTNNKQVFANNNNSQFAWVADVPDSKDKYVAIFNASPTPPPSARRGPRPPAPAADGSGGNIALASETGTGAGGVTAAATTPPAPATAPAPVPQSTEPAAIAVMLADLGLTGPVTVRDLWAHKDLGTVTSAVSATVNSHGAVLYRVSPAK